MYYQEEREQLSIEEFFQPFGGKLRKDNCWVKLAGIMPWEYIEKVYIKNMSEETGRPAISSRIAFGALFISTFCHLTDEGTVCQRRICGSGQRASVLQWPLYHGRAGRNPHFRYHRNRGGQGGPSRSRLCH